MMTNRTAKPYPAELRERAVRLVREQEGEQHWNVIASLIETCKLNAVDPQAYLASTLTRLINRSRFRDPA